MTPEHHLDDATLVSYSAGALPRALAVVVAAHLQMCGECRARLRAADSIGGLLMQRQDQTPPIATGREAMLALLDAESPSRERSAVEAVDEDDDLLPVSLRPYFAERFSQVRWKMLMPGVRQARARIEGPGSLVLFQIAPGTCLPEHGHGNSELTLVLKGAYTDALGHFGCGDIADLDEETEHQPIACADQPCICVAATDAPLRFSGWLPRLLQPIMRL